MKQALKNSDVVVGATTENVEEIEKSIGKKHHSIVRYLPENCINEVFDLNYKKFDAPKINMVFIGWMETRKAPLIILEALLKMKEDDRDKLRISYLGSGPMKDICENFVKNNNLTNVVKVMGRVERNEVFKMVSEAQLMLLPSLYDANTTVVWEAMAHAVPTLCLDHCGMRDTTKEKSGFKIPVTQYSSIVDKITEVFTTIVENPSRLKQKAESLLEDRMEYTWKKRIEKFEEIYALAEENFKKRKVKN